MILFVITCGHHYHRYHYFERLLSLVVFCLAVIIAFRERIIVISSICPAVDIACRLNYYV